MMAESAFKAKLVAATALVFLFGSGVVVGLAWDQTASASTLTETRRGERSERERTRRPMTIDRVGLSIVQKATVDSLYFFYGQRLSDLNTDFRPRYSAVMSDFRVELRQVLTDDQRVTYDALVLEREGNHTSRRRNNRDK
jgi:hypothetical protein